MKSNLIWSYNSWGRKLKTSQSQRHRVTRSYSRMASNKGPNSWITRPVVTRNPWTWTQLSLRGSSLTLLTTKLNHRKMEILTSTTLRSSLLLQCLITSTTSCLRCCPRTISEKRTCLTILEPLQGCMTSRKVSKIRSIPLKWTTQRSLRQSTMSPCRSTPSFRIKINRLSSQKKGQAFSSEINWSGKTLNLTAIARTACSPQNHSFQGMTIFRLRSSSSIKWRSLGKNYWRWECEIIRSYRPTSIFTLMITSLRWYQKTRCL